MARKPVALEIEEDRTPIQQQADGDDVSARLEQSWVPPALLYEGVMVASLRGLEEPLTKEQELVLYEKWVANNRNAFHVHEVREILDMPERLR